MNITVFTLFPSLIQSYCNESLLGKSLKNKLWNINIVDIRNYAEDVRKTVDDTPYSGGHGMVIKPNIVGKAIDNNCNVQNTKFFYMSPRGKHIDQQLIKKVLDIKNVAVLCGRYEGVDQRVIDEYNMEELSIGDFVLMGGEIPALAFIESLVRCIPDVVGDSNSIKEDSFGGASGDDFDYLLEYPIYTKPAIWKGRRVPNVLLSGNHKEIYNWKIKSAIEITRQRRVDVWQKYLEKKFET